MQVSPDLKYNQGQSTGFRPELNEKCICPICGFNIHHEAGIPCYYKSCPKCGMVMTMDK